MTLALIALTALPFIVSPGASFAITVDAVSKGDFRAPTKVWAGTSAGIVAVVSVAALSGIGSFLEDHQTARQLFGIVGGAVLILLGSLAGVRALKSARESSTSPEPARNLTLWSFLTLVTNVKALTLYTLIVPGLRSENLNPGALLVTFAAVHVVMLYAWQALVGRLLTRIPRIGTSPRARTFVAGLAALSLIAIGAQNVLELFR